MRMHVWSGLVTLLFSSAARSRRVSSRCGPEGWHTKAQLQKKALAEARSKEGCAVVVVPAFHDFKGPVCNEKAADEFGAALRAESLQSDVQALEDRKG